MGWQHVYSIYNSKKWPRALDKVQYVSCPISVPSKCPLGCFRLITAQPWSWSGTATKISFECTYVAHAQALGLWWNKTNGSGFQTPPHLHDQRNAKTTTMMREKVNLSKSYHDIYDTCISKANRPHWTFMWRLCLCLRFRPSLSSKCASKSTSRHTSPGKISTTSGAGSANRNS